MTTAQPNILAIDAGTTGVMAIAFDLELRPIVQAYREFPQYFPSPGMVEHDTREILEAVDEVVLEVVARSGAPGAVGITNQRETVVALDGATHAPLGRAIVWQDRRTAPRCRQLANQDHGEMIRARTGLPIDPYFSATKIEWMLKNDLAVRSAADRGSLRFATIDALIISHLTRGERLSTDPTNASRTMLFDIDARAYDDELLALFGVQAEMLPDVVPSAGDFGTAHLPGFGTTAPICGVLGDQQAALFGQGCFDAGSSKNTYGTGCFLLLNTGTHRHHSTAGLLTTLAADRRGDPCFALEGSVFAGGTVVQWLRDQLGVIDDAAQSEQIALSVDDTGGVILVPAFAGLGAPYWDPDARAALLGMTRGSSRAHIVRAGLDSIAFQCTDLIDALRADSGLALDELLVDGGATANDYLMQRQADLAGTRIIRGANVHATVRGAAAIAGVGAGLIDDPAGTEALRQERTTFDPALASKGRAEEMLRWRDAVRRVRSGF